MGSFRVTLRIALELSLQSEGKAVLYVFPVRPSESHSNSDARRANHISLEDDFVNISPQNRTRTLRPIERNAFATFAQEGGVVRDARGHFQIVKKKLKKNDSKSMELKKEHENENEK